MIEVTIVSNNTDKSKINLGSYILRKNTYVILLRGNNIEKIKEFIINRLSIKINDDNINNIKSVFTNNPLIINASSEVKDDYIKIEFTGITVIEPDIVFSIEEALLSKIIYFINNFTDLVITSIKEYFKDDEHLLNVPKHMTSYDTIVQYILETNEHTNDNSGDNND